MARQWTAAQQAAMDIRDKTLLVSAAAGSGKTATLTERIIRRITDKKNPADLSELLVVTFTRAAAEELKTRIFAALSEALAHDPTNRHLTSQLVKLGSAKISTIDSFYLELLRTNFSALGLSASFRIADPSEMALLTRSMMEESIEHLYETDDRFPAFAECFTGAKNAQVLTDTLFDVFEQVSTVPEGIEFLRISAKHCRAAADADTDFLATPFGTLLRTHATDAVRHALSVFEAACEELGRSAEQSAAMLPSFDYDRLFCLTLLEALADPSEGYRRACQAFEGFAPVRLKRLKEEFVTDESERFKALRTELHKQLRELHKRSFAKSDEVIRRAMADTAEYTELLYAVLADYEMRMGEEKQRRNMLDFSDIRRYTLRLLVDKDGKPTEIARQYAEQFSEIYIDEYQDVDRVQDMIFRAISRPDNRFMVGDIKQSIYGFRGAEPSVFADYRAAFPPYGKESENASGVTVFMSENFRCDETVIDFTNLVCARLFYACAESIGYCEADDLVFAKKPPRENYCPPKVQVCVACGNISEASDSGADSESTEEERPEKRALEAQYIAYEIHRLITEEKKADGTPITAGDIAVLFRSRSMSPYVADALAEYGILCSESDSARYFEDPDVLMVLSLLNTVDNPRRDIFLAGTLRSPLFGFDMNDLIRIRTACDATHSLYDALISYGEREDALAERCRRFDTLLCELRRQAAALPADRFLRILFESDLFVSSGLLCESDASGGGNLLRLYEYARTFEAGSFKGLYNFIEMINTLIEEGAQIKLPPKAASSDRVNLMTIHQSKGLEFPVCFVCGTAGRFNARDRQASLLVEYPVGIAMKLSDSTGFARINTPMREALAAHLTEKQNEEEMRVLYVALTRARERLYVTASSASEKETIVQKLRRHAAFCDRYTLLRCTSYLDWLLLPFADSRPDCAELSFVYPETGFDGEMTLTEGETAGKIPMDEALYELLRDRFAFRYPYEELRRIPAKLSISRLSPDVLDEGDNTPDLFAERKKKIPDLFLSGEPTRASAAERGTATHLFLQFCDFSALRQRGIAEELFRLVEKRFLPESLASLVYTEELEKFLDSELMKRLEQAKRIVREQRFNLLLPASAFTADTTRREALRDETVAVQGVIDLVLVGEDGSPELYDYKTDRLTKEELSDPALAQKRMQERHGLQLSYYAHAAELLFGKPCSRIGIYSTHAGRLFPIEPLPLALPQNFLDTL